MSDDSFIREVNEEIRQDQMQAVWKRYGSLLIGAAVAVVLVTAGYRAWDWYVTSQASASGDRFLAALNLASQGKNAEAATELDQLAKDGYGSYPLLARMRAATLLVQDGKVTEAVAAFDAVAADNSVVESIRHMASLRSAMLLVDHGTYEDVARRAEPLSADSSQLRHSAREALGLAAWKAGRTADALALFKQITDDKDAPANLRQRATVMSELINGAGNGS